MLWLSAHHKGTLGEVPSVLLQGDVLGLPPGQDTLAKGALSPVSLAAVEEASSSKLAHILPGILGVVMEGL